PEDFVIATGVQHSVREFIVWSARNLGIELDFQNQGVDELGVVVGVDGDRAPSVKVGDVSVRVDPRYFRPAEVETLLGDPSRAKSQLGWEPKVSVQQMCAEMIEEDLQAARRHAWLLQHGHDIPVPREGSLCRI